MTVETHEVAPVLLSPTRPLYWSVMRELWENRSIYIAPVGVAGVFLFGFLISTFGLPHRRRAVLLLDPTKQRAAIEQPYDIAAIMLLFTAIIIGFFYCLDALHGERSDRSLLFWKSLPVSDLTTVLSKVTIPVVVLPAIIFAIIVATQIVMMLWTSIILVMSGMSPASTWINVHLITNSLILLYGIIALVLWHAPIYGYLLLISASVKRAAFLWAVLPLLAIEVLERIAFGTTHFGKFLQYRFIGHVPLAFSIIGPHGDINSLSQLTPGRFLMTAGLWVGLVVAAILIAATVRLRRNREPI
jgi:ABC-2 type transport system permease protein